MKLLNESDYYSYIKGLINSNPKDLYYIGNGLFVLVNSWFKISFKKYDPDVPDFISRVVDELIISRRPTIILPYGDPGLLDLVRGTCLLFFIGDGYHAYILIEDSRLVLCFLRSIDGFFEGNDCLKRILIDKPYVGLGWGSCKVY